MASEITDADTAPSPTNLDESLNGAGDARGNKRQRTSTSGIQDDDEDDESLRERRKIEIKFISDKSRRHITFSKRKAGIMKKAYELSVLTGTQVLLLVVSETGLVYTFTTPKLQPLVTRSDGKNLIQNCLNAPEPADGHAVDGVETVVEPAEDVKHNPNAAMPMMSGRAQSISQTPYMLPDDQAALQYHQAYLQQGAAGYPMPTQNIPVQRQQ